MRKHKVLIIVCSILGISALGVAGCYFNDNLRSKVTSMVSRNETEENINPDNRMKTLDDEIVLDYQETAEDLKEATNLKPTYTDYKNSPAKDKAVPLVYNPSYDYYSNAVYDRFGEDCPESILELEKSYGLSVHTENGDYVCIHPNMNMRCEPSNCAYQYVLKFVLSGDCDILLDDSDYGYDEETGESFGMTKGTAMQYIVGEYVKHTTNYFLDPDGSLKLFGEGCDTNNLYDDIVAFYPDFANYGLKGVYVSDLMVMSLDTEYAHSNGTYIDD